MQNDVGISYSVRKQQKVQNVKQTMMNIRQGQMETIERVPNDQSSKHLNLLLLSDTIRYSNIILHNAFSLLELSMSLRSLIPLMGEGF